MHPYLPLVLLIVVGVFLCALMVIASWVLGPKKVTPYKVSPYECGVQPVGSARERFPVKFYLVAILFILFDIEVVFLWSWMAVFRGWVEAGHPSAVYSFWAVILYMFLWFLGDAYVIRAGALEWEESKTLHPEKLGKLIEEETVSVAEMEFPSLSRETLG